MEDTYLSGTTTLNNPMMGWFVMPKVMGDPVIKLKTLIGLDDVDLDYEITERPREVFIKYTITGDDPDVVNNVQTKIAEFIDENQNKRFY